MLTKMSLSFMNAENKLTIKPVNLDDTRLPSVIYGAIGNPSPEKVLGVIGSYKNPDHAVIGAFIGDILVGVLGLCNTSKIITIRHISVPLKYQRQGIGTLLLEEITKQYGSCKIIAETDMESVDFYAKSGFTCHEFKGPYGNLRYKCEFNL
ncbi:MAG: GNAT family N-acetyltransferase [Rickettsiales bacterium]|nr:MAG: GNAT family N-acetyltransferase [Rickettsiales bacterium]